MATHSQSVRGAHESRSDLVGALGSVEPGEPIRRIGRLTDMKGRFLVLVAMAMVVAACANAVDGTGSTLDRGPSGGRAESAPTSGSDTPARPQVAALVPTDGVDRSDPLVDARLGDLVTGMNNAGFELWQIQPRKENLVFSPASIGNGMLMVRAAADDITGSAIDSTFGFPPGLEAHQAWNATEQLIASDAAAQAEITVTIADRVWPGLDAVPDQAWIDLLAAEHGASIETLDFVGASEPSRDAINSWVGDQTDGLIPELLPEGSIGDDTILVLTDAVYFKAPWQIQFGKYASVIDDFVLPSGSTIEVEYMRELELADRRGAGDGFVGAEIPYVGGDFSMLVIVPEAGRFDEVRDRLDQTLLDEIDATFTVGPYELLIPQWATASEIDLVGWLTQIGAAPGLYPSIDPQAWLDGAVHGADVTVDGWGTVAAAATSITFASSGPPEPEFTVKADRPFLYLIRHRVTGLVLFAGQVSDPTAGN
ncbi:MAG: serpin family protein [Acidimicrobiia bacterium]